MDHLFVLDGIIHNNNVKSISRGQKSILYYAKRVHMNDKYEMRSFSCHIPFIVITKIEARTNQIQI